jgi:hypothetical protein
VLNPSRLLLFAQHGRLRPSPSPRQPGQTSVDEVKKSDLRAELVAAEVAARAKKRKAAGLPVEDEQPAVTAMIEDEEANKRRKVLQEALELDKDADSDEDEDEDKDKDGPKEDAKCVARGGLSSCSNLPSSPPPKKKKTAETNTREAKVVAMMTMARATMRMTTRMTRTRTTLQSYFGSSRR